MLDYDSWFLRMLASLRAVSFWRELLVVIRWCRGALNCIFRIFSMSADKRTRYHWTEWNSLSCNQLNASTRKRNSIGNECVSKNLEDFQLKPFVEKVFDENRKIENQVMVCESRSEFNQSITVITPSCHRFLLLYRRHLSLLYSTVKKAIVVDLISSPSFATLTFIRRLRKRNFSNGFIRTRRRRYVNSHLFVFSYVQSTYALLHKYELTNKFSMHFENSFFSPMSLLNAFY